MLGKFGYALVGMGIGADITTTDRVTMIFSTLVLIAGGILIYVDAKNKRVAKKQAKEEKDANTN